MVAEQVISSSLRIVACFYDLLERDDVVIGDRGFQIQQDLFIFVTYKYLEVHDKERGDKKRDTKYERNCKFTNSR